MPDFFYDPDLTRSKWADRVIGMDNNTAVTVVGGFRQYTLDMALHAAGFRFGVDYGKHSEGSVYVFRNAAALELAVALVFCEKCGDDMPREHVCKPQPEADVQCRACGSTYTQRRLTGMSVWPPFCCGVCGSRNVRVAVVQ